MFGHSGDVSRTSRRLHPRAFCPPPWTLALLMLLVHDHTSMARAELDEHGESTDLRGDVSIQIVVDDFRTRLAMAPAVRVTVVPRNPLMVSVETVDDPVTEFQLSFERSFLDELSDDELKAVVAHELGHVWIFTHHPFLQTEALANQIARRLVTRESLVRVYEKVWRAVGTKGDLARFLSD